MTPCFCDPGITIIIMGIITLPSITKEESIRGFPCTRDGLFMIPYIPINAGNIGMITDGRTVCGGDFTSVENTEGYDHLGALITE
jgi:hypothetical protein